MRLGNRILEIVESDSAVAGFLSTGAGWMRQSRATRSIVRLVCSSACVGLVVLAATGAVRAESLAERLDAIIDSHPTASSTVVTLKVKDLENGEVLYDRHGGWLLTPASNLKLYTSAAALDEFGPEHRFTTEVGFDGFVSGETLAGTLVLRGGGDAMLKSSELQQIAKRVREELQLSTIRGDIVVDESLFDSPRKGPGWMWDDDPTVYNMSISALQVDFNTLTVEVSETTPGEPVQVLLKPASDYPLIRNEARTIARGETTITIDRRPFEDVITVSGVIVSGDKPSTRTITMHDPALWVGHVFRQMLLREGVAVDGSVRVTREPTNVRASIVHQGETVAAAIRHFNRTSENAVGEMLLHNMAVNRSKVPATWPEGARIISDWLVDVAGLERGSFRLVDGSGLTRYNLINADSSVRLLEFMNTHRHADVYFESLPVYEVELSDGSKQRLVHAKPGGMSGVSTLSGYIKTLDGRTLVFSCLGNGYIGSNAPLRDLRGQIFRTLAESASE